MTEQEAPLAEHLERPHIRNFQPLGMQQEGKPPIVLLRDPSMLAPQTMAVQPQVLPLILQFQGRETLQELSERTKAPMNVLREIVTRMDELGLLWGPRFEELERLAKARITEGGKYPLSPTLGSTLGTTRESASERIAGWMAQAEDPEIPGTIAGIVAPHLDYERGWHNYASAYRALSPDTRPDRVVILGTNHFGIGDGVVLTEFGFETPMGTMPADRAALAFLERALGSKRIYADQMDHLGEHSILLHLPWVQHLYGDVPTVAALVPDPMRPPIADDGARATTPEFEQALRTALGELGGRTLFIASSDLSHVGPQFGDPGPVTDPIALQVEQLDRERLRLYCAGDAKAFEAPFAAQNNVSRWCSLGSMGSLLRLTNPASVEMIDYRQIRETNGASLVSCAALAVTARP
jgi:AmmeMemoRadiSam system protein B